MSGRALRRAAWGGATALAFGLGAAPAAAQQCTTDHRELASAVYAQVLEYGSTKPGLDYWSAQFAGGATVKQMMRAHLTWAGYNERFVNGRTSREVLTYLWRHILAREPDAATWGWASVGETQGWTAVIDALLNGAEYGSRFGDHAVPGSPVTAWDCARAKLVTVAHHEGIRDATQGGASVSFTTPAYTSLGQARALTFVYSSGLADPRTLVQLDVLDNSPTPPSRISLRVRNGSNADMTFTNGTQEVFFAAGAGATRIAAEFRDPQNPNLAVTYTAVVRKHFADRVEEHLLTVRAANLNARESMFGNGWYLQGLQRVYDQGGGVHIVENGTGTFFWYQFTDAEGNKYYGAPSGDFTQVTWNDPSQTFQRRYPDGTLVRYSNTGLMVDVRDRHGNVTEYGYNAAGWLIYVKDPLGKAFDLGYLGSGVLSWVQDPTGRRVTTSVNGRTVFQWWQPDHTWALDLNFVSDPVRGNVLTEYWTPGGERSVLNSGTVVGYDAHGRVASLTAPTASTTDAGGAGVTRPVARARSLQSVVLAQPGTGSPTNASPRVVPTSIRLEATDPRGNVTKMAVDPFGAPTRVEEPLGRVSTATRDRHGRAMRSVSPSGHTLLREYVGIQLRRELDETTGAEVLVDYEPTYHQPTHVRGSGTTETWYRYDSQHRLERVESGNSVTLYKYSTRGRVGSITDPEGHGTTYAYGDSTGGNAWGNLHLVTAGTRVTTHLYDAYSRASTVISPGRDTARTEYDLLNRVVKSTDPAGRVTSYAYKAGRLHVVTNPKAETRTFNHNALGWLVSEVDPRGQTTSYRYDRAGNLTGTTNRRGQIIAQGYNALNQPIWRDADGQRTNWGYDPAGRWVTAGNPSSTADRMDFDVAGRMVQESSRGHVIQSQHNLRGQRTEVRMAMGPRVVKYGYNARGQLETLTDMDGGVTTITYNDDGQETGRTLPTALGVGRDYPSTHSEATIGYNDDGLNVALGRSYGYNANGNVGQERRRQEDGYADGDRVRTYTYDRLSRLTGYADQLFKDNAAGGGQCGAAAIDPNGGACMPGGPDAVALGSAAYSYDAQGNRTDLGAVIDKGDRLTSFRGFTMEYDADGNLTRKYRADGSFDQRLVWNSLGQLTSVSTSGVGEVRFAYDGWGRRIGKYTPQRNHYYVYDGKHVFLEGSDCCWEADLAYYPGTDRPHSIRRNGQIYYYQTDALGSVTGLTNSANQLVNRYQYTPWGELETGESTYTTYDPLGFTARERDDETKLYHYRARYYDPQLGRFISEDPIGIAGGSNVYAYVSNNPVNDRDPTGLEEECIDWYLVTINTETGEVISERKLYTTCTGSGGGGGSGGSGSETASPDSEQEQCPDVPTGPPGVSLDKNMAQAAGHWDPRWFRDQVKAGGPWDYKLRGRNREERASYEIYGNFHYGATGGAFGFPLGTLLEEAGRAQIASGTSTPPSPGAWGRPGSRINPFDGVAPYGDQPSDQYWIRAGYEYFRCRRDS